VDHPTCNEQLGLRGALELLENVWKPVVGVIEELDVIDS